jgi:hypothetical protein
MMQFFHSNNKFNFKIKFNNLNYKIKIMCIKVKVKNIFMFNKYDDSYFYVTKIFIYNISNQTYYDYLEIMQ